VCDIEARECALRYASAEMRPADIRRYVEEGAAACFSRNPRELMGQGECLPLQLGTDVRNRKTVELSYFCSDVCPDYGRVLILYAGVDEVDCCKIGGHPFYDPAWRPYVGCQPPEVPLPRFNWPASDGRMNQAVGSPCDPSKITFVDDEPGQTP